ncbi:MAG: DUF4185 domain-containing protein [Armatimonadetes bacterium]|nr:DUF4185 domain-containing protein [Armatimonadota bacterium]
MIALALPLLCATLAPAGPRVVSVENAGLLFTDNQAGVSGVDAGYSLPIGKETLWLFGDVFLLHPTDPQKRYVGGVSNAALVTSARTALGLRQYRFITDRATGLARQVIPNMPGEGNETRLWPAGGWYDAQARKVYLFWARIRTTGGGGPFDFRLDGHGLAMADASKLDQIRFERLMAEGGDELWWPHADGRAVYGAAVVRGPEARPRYLYIVGVEERHGKKVGKLARVPAASIARSGAYEYFSGSPDRPSWSADPAQAADIEGLTDFPSELSVAHNRYLGGYLAVHSVGIADRIRLSLAADPWGPYRQIAEIGAPHRAFEKAFCYAGKEHPELAEQTGKVIYVTYVDSQRYWLQMLKVTFER